MKVCEFTSQSYWRAPFPSLCSSKELVEYVVLDVEAMGPTRGKVNIFFSELFNFRLFWLEKQRNKETKKQRNKKQRNKKQNKINNK